MSVVNHVPGSLNCIRSAAAKLREKLGGKKARGKRGNRKAGGVSAETEEEGTGEAQPPPQKLPRVDAMAVDEAEEKEEEWKEEGAEKSDPLEGNAEQDEDNEGGDKEGDAANGVEVRSRKSWCLTSQPDLNLVSVSTLHVDADVES